MRSAIYFSLQAKPIPDSHVLYPTFTSTTVHIFSHGHKQSDVYNYCVTGALYISHVNAFLLGRAIHMAL
jgi:hypothetical protein